MTRIFIAMLAVLGICMPLYAQDNPLTVAPPDEGKAEAAPLYCVKTVEFVWLKLNKDQAESIAIQFDKLEKEKKAGYATLYLTKDQIAVLKQMLNIDARHVVFVSQESRRRSHGASYWSFPKSAAEEILLGKPEKCPEGCKCEKCQKKGENCPEGCKCEKCQKKGENCPEGCKCEKCQKKCANCPEGGKCEECQKKCAKCPQKCGKQDEQK